MSDKPISVGDLVIQVRPIPCACHIGSVFKVEMMEPSPSGYIKCPSCDVCATTGIDAYGKFGKIYGCGWLPVDSLKRIPPLDELEGEKRDEEISA